MNLTWSSVSKSFNGYFHFHFQFQLQKIFIMSASDGEPFLSGFEIPPFHGERNEDSVLLRIPLRALCHAKGVWEVGEHRNETYWHVLVQLSPPTWLNLLSVLSEKYSGVIVVPFGNILLQVVIEALNFPNKRFQRLGSNYAYVCSRISVQTELFWMEYNYQNIDDDIEQYTSLFVPLDRMEKEWVVLGFDKAPTLLASVSPKCNLKATVAALRTKEPSELASAYVAITYVEDICAKCATRAFLEHGSQYVWSSMRKARN